MNQEWIDEAKLAVKDMPELREFSYYGVGQEEFTKDEIIKILQNELEIKRKKEEIKNQLTEETK